MNILIDCWKVLFKHLTGNFKISKSANGTGIADLITVVISYIIVFIEIVISILIIRGI